MRTEAVLSQRVAERADPRESDPRAVAIESKGEHKE
jgi:hypothetical protein